MVNTIGYGASPEMVWHLLRPGEGMATHLDTLCHKNRDELEQSGPFDP